MCIFKNAYETTAGLIMESSAEKAKKAIIEAIITTYPVGLDVAAQNEYKPYFITGINDAERKIPIFTHPISLKYKDYNYICSDIRFFVSKLDNIGEIENHIKNRTEYNFAKGRTIVELLFSANGSYNVKNSLAFASVVFSAWLSEIVANTFALDFKDKTVLSIITSFYYQSLFSPKSVFDEEDKQKMAVHTIKATKMDAKTIFEVFDKIGELKNINDYCENVKNILENVRMKDFNLAILLTIIRNSWYGVNSKDCIAVALEHIPTWVSIVYSSLNERTYKNCAIAKIAERMGKRGAADEFNKAYEELIASSKESNYSFKERFNIPDFD